MTGPLAETVKDQNRMGGRRSGQNTNSAALPHALITSGKLFGLLVYPSLMC